MKGLHIRMKYKEMFGKILGNEIKDFRKCLPI